MAYRSTSAPSDGSRTITIHDSQTGEQTINPRPDDNFEQPPIQPVGTLRLQGGRRPRRQHVAWGEDVVDNEDCGKKSSKICCIYHKPKKFDESSDEESSGSESDSSYDGVHHSHRRARGQGPGGNVGERDGIRELADVNESNAYEIVPVSKKGKRKAESK